MDPEGRSSFHREQYIVEPMEIAERSVSKRKYRQLTKSTDRAVRQEIALYEARCRIGPRFGGEIELSFGVEERKNEKKRDRDSRACQRMLRVSSVLSFLAASSGRPPSTAWACSGIKSASSLNGRCATLGMGDI